LVESLQAEKSGGSIPNEVTGFFNSPNPSSLSMALGSNQPLTEMSTMNLPGGKWERRVRLTISTPSVSRKSRICRSLDVSEPSGKLQGWFYFLL
jgi:hypothetical protein